MRALLALPFVLVALPALAQAPAPPAPPEAPTTPQPFRATQPLGHPPRDVTWSLATADGAVHLHGPGLDATLPLASFASAQLAPVTLAGGVVVDVLTVTGDDGSASVILGAPGGRPRVVWSGRTDLRGDPGERHAFVVEVDDRDGDGADDILVAEVREGVHICGADRTLLDPRRVDPRTLALQPVELMQLPLTGPPGTMGSSGVGLTSAAEATPTSPGPTGAPVGGPLRFVAASSTSGAAPGDLDAQTRPPRALEAPTPTGFWAEGHGGPGRGQFVTARRELAWPIRAFAITPAPADAALAAQLGRPRTLWLIGEDEARVYVTLPDAPPGTRLWVTLDDPRPWHCVSVVLDDATAPRGVAPAAVHTGLAAVEAYTDLDFADGLPRLVREVESDGPAAAAAADALGRAGEPGVTALVAALPRMTPAGRRRSARVLQASLALPAARDALVSLARDDDADVREAADGALARDADGLLALAGVAATHGATGDDAAHAIAARADVPASVVQPLLDAVQSGTERRALRDALAAAVAHDVDAAGPVVQAWAAHATPDAVAAAALALSRPAQTGALAVALVAAAAPHATGFPARWRFVVAAAQAPASAEVDAWLRTTEQGATEWMLRDGALTALLARHADGALDVARAALADPYPRVRLTALRAVAGTHTEADIVSVATLARRDHWPFVRAAAVTALAGEPRARPIVLAAVEDANEHVRAAAVVALTQARDRAAYAAVDARLRDEAEWPVVVAAAVAYVDALCVTEAGDALIGVVKRAVKPQPYEPDVDVAALALQVAVKLGGRTSTDALAIATRSGAPESLHALAGQLRAHPPAACTGTR